jgi:hypothetical protein
MKLLAFIFILPLLNRGYIERVINLLIKINLFKKAMEINVIQYDKIFIRCIHF